MIRISVASYGYFYFSVLWILRQYKGKYTLVIMRVIVLICLVLKVVLQVFQTILPVVCLIDLKGAL